MVLCIHRGHKIVKGKFKKSRCPEAKAAKEKKKTKNQEGISSQATQAAKFHVKGSHQAFDVGFDHEALFCEQDGSRSFGAFEFEAKKRDLCSVDLAGTCTDDADLLIDDLLLIDTQHLALERAPGFGVFEREGEEVKAGGLKSTARKGFGEGLFGLPFLPVDHDFFGIEVSPSGGFFATDVGVCAELDQLVVLVIAAAVVFSVHFEKEIAGLKGATVKDDGAACGIHPFFADDLAGLGSTKKDIVSEDALS